MLGSWRIRQWRARRRLRRLTREAAAAVARFPLTRDKRSHGLPQPLIVNLTSYPLRYPTLAPTLRALLDQTVRADRTILWLAEGDVAALPEEVLKLGAHGLEIRTCDDLRSYKKLLPALARWPDAYHVTADDDVYYPPDWLGGLVGALDPARRDVVAWRAHVARPGPDGRVLPYAQWEMNAARTHADAPDSALFPTGVGGILYPPGSLHPDVFDPRGHRELCPRGDDIWFYWMTRRAGRRHVRVDRMLDLIEWPSSQEVGLRVDNLEGDGNDRQIRAMEAVYGAFPF